MNLIIHQVVVVVTGIAALFLFHVAQVELRKEKEKDQEINGGGAGDEEEEAHSDDPNISSGGGKMSVRTKALYLLVIIGCLGGGIGYLILYIPLQGGAIFYFFFSWVVWFAFSIAGCFISGCFGACCNKITV